MGILSPLRACSKGVREIEEELKKEGREIKEIFILGVFGYMPFPKETSRIPKRIGY